MSELIHAAVRMRALEEAADLLMDHGLVTSSKDLVDLCDRIRALASAPQHRMYIEVRVSELVIMQSNAPRDMVIGLLRDRGIPAYPDAVAHPTAFGTSIRVNPGWLHHMHDFQRGEHIFKYDPEGAPF